LIKTTLYSVALLCGTVSLALGHDDYHGRDPGHCMSAPELDPSMMVTALMVMGAGLVLMRGRKARS
jgi:hypothetical protein